MKKQWIFALKCNKTPMSLVFLYFRIMLNINCFLGRLIANAIGCNKKMDKIEPENDLL